MGPIPINPHRVERRTFAAQPAVAICLAPGKQQRHCKAMPTRRRRSHSRTRITLLDDPELLGLTEPPTPARIHDLEPFDTASICKDIHTDSLLSDRPVKPRRSLAEAYASAVFPQKICRLSSQALGGPFSCCYELVRPRGLKGSWSAS